MSAVSNLPCELLLSVFANLADDKATLRACALVNARWRRPAQAVLHQALDLSSVAKLNSWLAHNGGNDYWARRLEVKAAGAAGRDKVEAAMRRVRGLRELKVEVDRAKFGLDWLENDELSREYDLHKPSYTIDYLLTGFLSQA